MKSVTSNFFFFTECRRPYTPREYIISIIYTAKTIVVVAVVKWNLVIDQMYPSPPRRAVSSIWPNLVKNECFRPGVVPEHIQSLDDVVVGSRIQAGSHTGGVKGDEHRAAIGLPIQEAFHVRGVCGVVHPQQLVLGVVIVNSLGVDRFGSGTNQFSTGVNIALGYRAPHVIYSIVSEEVLAEGLNLSTIMSWDINR